MKSVRIGITNNFKSLLFDNVYLRCSGRLSVTQYTSVPEHIQILPNQQQRLRSFVTYTPLSISAHNDLLLVNNDSSLSAPVLLLEPNSDLDNIFVGREEEITKNKSYNGKLLIIAEKNKLRLVLICSLEKYVKAVLRGEIPASYHIEAIKAQAVAIRTYALNPRVDHTADFCQVCDSYLCCQCFSNIAVPKTSPHFRAVMETEEEVLTYNDKPILALFSSCAGGHTENYENCFSDWKTNIFPPQPLPYLRGVSEELPPQVLPSSINETSLRQLWHSAKPNTADSWAKQFRWSIKFTYKELENHLHHNALKLLEQKDSAPYVIPPKSEIFGDIISFDVTQRGTGGTAVYLNVRTSKGDWQFIKELTIRNLFQLNSRNIKRLPSAKIFFAQPTHINAEVDYLTIYGLGSGHGVGLQQVGAQGHAKNNKNYKQILRHYYDQAILEKL